MAYTTAESESELGAVIKRLTRTKKRVALTRRGKPVAAVVSIQDLEYLEALEAREDAEDVKACKAASKSKKNDLIPWEKVKKELGYD
jgi:prevent-host-death family protein